MAQIDSGIKLAPPLKSDKNNQLISYQPLPPSPTRGQGIIIFDPPPHQSGRELIIGGGSNNQNPTVRAQHKESRKNRWKIHVKNEHDKMKQNERQERPKAPQEHAFTYPWPL